MFFSKFFKNKIEKGDSIIDFGCGTGRSATPLLKAGLKTHLVDFCEDCLDPDIFLQTVGSDPLVQFVQGCLWDLPTDLEAADWIISFDLLEHLPEEKVDASLKAMASRMKKGGLISLCMIEDEFGKDIGTSLHLTIKPSDWWRKKVSAHFSIAQELHNNEKNLVWAISPLKKS